MNPFAHRTRSIHGPTTDPLPITQNDATDLPIVAIALNVETGGTVVLDTDAGETCAIVVSDFSILPLGTTRVRATDTTATGIHALLQA